jgi:hypothetical protein
MCLLIYLKEILIQKCLSLCVSSSEPPELFHVLLSATQSERFCIKIL